MKTVHLIGNAHLDPVWLWQKAEGADATVATARSACDLLEEFPQFIFTCSGSWFHQQVELQDPALFARIRRLVDQGRWQLVGGMVVQPDCNLLTAASFARQLQAGQTYYRSRFGQQTRVGYNVDSFGHTAYLPRFLRAAGIDCYVFMRPGPQEKQLPSLFRWRSPDGQEVLTFRIAGAYNASGPELARPIEQALAAMPEGVEHTMCFYGVGDHGGGPTRRQIEWILANADAIPGVRLVMSHPRAFFEAVAGQAGHLPLVNGEFQHHAIGCYSVERRIKVSMRRAEAALAQAEGVSAMYAAGQAAPQEAIEQAWSAVLFNQFHDVLGGTCLDEASRLAAGGMAAAQSRAEDLSTVLTRRAFRQQAEPGKHKIVIVNPAERPFEGWIQHRPWVHWAQLKVARLLDEHGREIRCQVVEGPAKVGGLNALLFRLGVPARSSRVLYLAEALAQASSAGESNLLAEPGRLTGPGMTVQCDRDGASFCGCTLRLEVHEDISDTWSHSCGKAFAVSPAGSFELAEWTPLEQGPLRASLRALGQFNHSRAWCRLALLAGEPMLRLHLSIIWAEACRRLVLRVNLPQAITSRTDLVSGGPLDRPADGREYPLSGGLVVQAGEHSLAVAAPELFSVAVDAKGIAITLLRSPYVAHHDPFPIDQRSDQPMTDQGRHEIDLVFWPGCTSIDAIAPLGDHMLTGPIVWDLTG